MLMQVKYGQLWIKDKKSLQLWNITVGNKGTVSKKVWKNLFGLWRSLFFQGGVKILCKKFPFGGEALNEVLCAKFIFKRDEALKGLLRKDGESYLKLLFLKLKTQSNSEIFLCWVVS